MIRLAVVFVVLVLCVLALAPAAQAGMFCDVFALSGGRAGYAAIACAWEIVAGAYDNNWADGDDLGG